MSWSIYAYLPFIWLGLVVFYGLTRAHGEVELERVTIKLSCRWELPGMFAIPIHDPYRPWDYAYKHIYSNLFKDLMSHISIEEHQNNIFEGSILVFKKGNLK